MIDHPGVEDITRRFGRAPGRGNGAAPLQEPPGVYAPPGAPAAPSGGQERRLPPLKIIRPEESRGMEISERKFIVPGMVPRGVVTGLYGPPGKGKSTLAMQLQAATAIGGEWCGRTVEQVKSVGVYCEDDADELMRRWRRIEDHMPIGENDLRNARMVSRLGEDNILATFTRTGKIEMTPLHRQLVELAKDEHAELFIFDMVSDGFAGNENDRTQVRQFVQSALATIARDIGGAVMFLAHPSRAGVSDGSGQSGSTAWEGTVRSRLYLRDEDAPDGAMPDKDARVLSVMKANYAPSGESVRLRYSNGAFASDFPAGNPYRPPAEDVFLSILDAMNAQGQRVSATRMANNYAPREFRRHPQRQGYLERDFEGAMTRLFDRDMIRVEEAGPPSKRVRWIVRCPAPPVTV